MVEKCSFYSLISLGIPEMQTKTTLRFHLIPARMAKIDNTKTNGGVDVGKEEHLFTAVRGANGYSHYEDKCGVCSRS